MQVKGTIRSRLAGLCKNVGALIYRRVISICSREGSVLMELTMQKTWFITGASRGLGVQIAKAAMQAGDRAEATGRKRASVNSSLGPDSDQLLSVELDVTDADQAQAAVDAAVSRFGAIDVLVNTHGYAQRWMF